MEKKKSVAIFFAILAAIFYAINMPLSKILLEYLSSTMLAGLLYLGAGIGVGIIFFFSKKKIKREELLRKSDLPYIIGMVVLDIAAPILLLYGLSKTNSSTASLLNNFEIVATSLIALIAFKEIISKRMWIAISIITISSFFLSVDDIRNISFSYGSLSIVLATICWGLENNFTRKISHKNTYEIVTIKGLCCGVGSICISLIIREAKFDLVPILLALLLGFVAYGLSITFYIKAQKHLGAAKTSAYYAIAPFIGTLLSVIILNESLSVQYFVGFGLMIIGSILVSIDTLLLHHSHMHTHLITHTHDGVTHVHEITHSHPHNHYMNLGIHTHVHILDKHSHDNYRKLVAFICVHNSCRSQIAEALCKKYRSDLIAFSAGTETKPEINQDAVRIMMEKYGINMQEQKSKLIADIPQCDIYVSMGCNVGCPFVGRGYDYDLNIDDPTGKSDEAFIEVIEEIKKKVMEL